MLTTARFLVYRRQFWASHCGSHRKKRLRRRGKRAGALVKLRYLARSCSISPSSFPLHLFDDGSDQRSCYFHQHSMEPRYASLRPVWPVRDELPQAALNIPARLRVKRGGAVLHNLRPLAWMPPPSDHEATAVVPTPVEVKMALINANHISNKTFVLNDFATKNGLHFLMVTETWVTPA
ncbi:hypothetical protein AAFF_G00102930 [Aldrovandia affinis]|uniref:Uncharacterized protein n=1 Tax=Aldrovandia affinis TaxID=143900 RepID=A0AAD7RU74_9TELE|nr:hypothetical protein AAFF_G00102930 [Aldrovandia affinis]